MTPHELSVVRQRLETFAADVFAPLARSDQRAKGQLYIRGLLLDGRRKSMQPMAARLGVDHQGLQAQGGLSPAVAAMTVAAYGEEVMWLATRGPEPKTVESYESGWRLRVVPTLGHLLVRALTNGAVDRAVYGWIDSQCGRSVVKNSLAILVRVMEQAVRDGVIDRKPGSCDRLATRVPASRRRAR